MENEDNFDLETDFDPPEEHLSRIEETRSAREDGIGLFYALGMAIAVTLSWARNASILWCILHGIFSWGYVIYFAVTR